MKAIYRIFRQVAGWALIALGLVSMLLPIAPGLLFLAAGALLLAPYVRIFRRFSAWLHKRYPHLRGPLRYFRDYKVRHKPASANRSFSVSSENHLAKPAPPAQSDPDETRHTPP